MVAVEAGPATPGLSTICTVWYCLNENTQILVWTVNIMRFSERCW